MPTHLSNVRYYEDSDTYHYSVDNRPLQDLAVRDEELRDRIDAVANLNQATLDGKVDKVPGKALSSNDFTDAEKQKLANISGGAQANTVDSVNGKVGEVILTKTDIGLSNVDNTSDIYKPVSTAQQTALDLKVDKVPGKALSTNDYTTAEKNKLSGIQAGAQVNLPVIDSLVSFSTDMPLSANQGRILKGLVDAINALLETGDANLDELREIVEFIKLNRELLENLTIASIAGLQTALDNKQPLDPVLSATTASFTTTLLTKLNGIEEGATADMTPAELLAAVKTVDGSGSGLDADLLDGKHLATIETEYKAYTDSQLITALDGMTLAFNQFV